ncbi:MAG TPA: bifunctional diaminohydroxyphosphoribosylaminopyrimidine deaminase/5-amino-6-(5-phosphoribosylamino)uracil reductase RibD [Dehalococcoidia bacterium]|nr:bifunctional diaminohydroxyphosphoribosylaminopyrimidine deaminase/5-amino-6-(5-phosphoribosylamino)uracil reductase RibD [Dehalococcoidia bacterium]
MECALSLAGLALGYTSPNPAVGAVVVRDGVVVGLGHTQPPGSVHAEVMALRQAGARAKGATMYVTLEPCCHQGRTPPCTQAIIDAGISEVHMSLIDPNPLVSGKGLKMLEEAGVKTFVGEYEERAREINEGYIKFITTGMPFVIAKFAMSLDGKIATQNGDSKWISGDESRKFVHYLRHIVDAIMVGANTVVADDPQLSARGCSGKGGKTKQQPLRVIVDGRGRTPLSARVFEEPGNTVIAVAKPFDAKKMEDFLKAGAEVVELPAEQGVIDLGELLNLLGKRQVTSILVEGGNKLFGSLFDRGLIDKVLAFISPIIIGGEGAKSAVGGNGVGRVAEALRLNRVKISELGDDILISGYLGGR